MEELAVFGGKPVREKPIFYGRQYIDQEDVEAVTKVLTADVITSGPQVSDLEKHLCEITHAKYAVAVCNDYRRSLIAICLGHRLNRLHLVCAKRNLGDIYICLLYTSPSPRD